MSERFNSITRCARCMLACLLVFAPALGAQKLSAGSTGSSISRSIRQDRCREGIYSAIVAGFFEGRGRAQVRRENVRLTAVLRGDDGHSVYLDVELAARGPYFGGRATVHSGSVMIWGRLDAARCSRLAATYAGPDGRSGRIVATLPHDECDETWDLNRFE